MKRYTKKSNGFSRKIPSSSFWKLKQKNKEIFMKWSEIFFYKKAAAGNRKGSLLVKKYVLIAGVNGAGKSTLYQTLQALQNMSRVNMDEILREF